MSDAPGTPPPGSTRLRNKADSDAEFLLRVYASTRAEELALTNWTASQKEHFCRLQFEAQSVDYARNYPHAQYSIIEHNGQPVGRLMVDRRETAVHIIDIALLPDARGGGLGTYYLRELMQEASASGKVLSIHVEKFNRALRLYLRLGFQPVEDKGIYLLMEWKPSAPATA
jgi:ribosomal protein S18 acetylase RimI-like enzyme